MHVHVGYSANHLSLGLCIFFILQNLEKESCLFNADIVAFLQAEADLRVSQGEFDRQYEVTKLLLDGISTAHVSEIMVCHRLESLF